MIVYPAIDIREGRCVRLVEGDFDRETVFGEDPATIARRWESDGASWIHIVDLDGAKTGAPANRQQILGIRASVSCRLQVGGGIRDEATATAYLDSGIDRIVLGTTVIENLTLVQSLARQWPGRIAAGLDARNGKLATAGWIEQTEIDAISAALELSKSGIEKFIYTDIARDGTLSGPNLPALESMVAQLGSRVIASGGVGTLEDLQAIRRTGAGGVIVGRALYDGRITLPEALAAAI